MQSTKRKMQRIYLVHIESVHTEQVIEFKYLGYCISEYKSDLEDKLQTYNKINGTIQRHFGKQMTKETKLRIHNITAKAALKFGSEVWVLKKKQTFRSSTDEISETITGNHEIR
jgi:hypothetical protein